MGLPVSAGPKLPSLLPAEDGKNNLAFEALYVSPTIMSSSALNVAVASALTWKEGPIVRILCIRATQSSAIGSDVAAVSHSPREVQSRQANVHDWEFGGTDRCLGQNELQ